MRRVLLIVLICVALLIAATPSPSFAILYPYCGQAMVATDITDSYTVPVFVRNDGTVIRWNPSSFVQSAFYRVTRPETITLNPPFESKEYGIVKYQIVSWESIEQIDSTSECGYYSISGRVTDTNNTPIAEVIISDNKGHIASTSTDGKYSLSGVELGTYTLTPTKDSYTFSPTSRSINVSADATWDVNFTAIPGSSNPSPIPSPTHTAIPTPPPNEAIPTINWIKPVNNREVYSISSGIVDLEVSATHSSGINMVGFVLLDNTNDRRIDIGSDDAPPYQASIDVSTLSPDRYEVHALAIPNTGNAASEYFIIERTDNLPEPSQSPTPTIPTPTPTSIPSPPSEYPALTITLDGGGEVPTGQAVNLVARIKNEFNSPVPSITVQFVVTGFNSARSSSTTDNNGQAHFSYTGNSYATDTVLAYIDINNNSSQDVDEPSSMTTVEWIPFYCIGGSSCNGVPVPQSPLPDPYENFRKFMDPLFQPAGCVLDLAQVDEIKKAVKWSEQLEQLEDLSQLLSILENQSKPIELLLDLLPGADCIRIIVDKLAPNQREALNKCLQEPACAQLLRERINDLTSFKSVWGQTDWPLAQTQVNRTWIWGPAPRTGPMYETYREGYVTSNFSNLSEVNRLNNWRVVLYFDKSRMEITSPDTDSHAAWYITNGLLVVELIEGRIQSGDSSFETYLPAEQAVAGDPAEINPNAPTYRSFRTVAYPVTPSRSPKRNGVVVTDVLAKDGSTWDNPSLAHYNVTIASYEEQLGHNLPKVFTDFFDQQGLVYENGHYIRRQIIDWLFVLGLPISEPYWARVKVGGVEKDVLMQAFQRRVLTYTPSNPMGFQVEMGNVGQHYYRWRYGIAQPNMK